MHDEIQINTLFPVYVWITQPKQNVKKHAERNDAYVCRTYKGPRFQKTLKKI